MRLYDADALVDALMMYTWYDEDGFELDDAEPKREYIKKWLPDIPTIEPKRGRWIRHTTNLLECSVCGKYTHDHDAQYCPHCGLPMLDGGDADETDKTLKWHDDFGRRTLCLLKEETEA